MDLYPYQMDAANWLADRNEALLHGDMGIGKTPITIAAADRVDAKNVLVLCPAVARRNWAREFKRWQATIDRPVRVIESGDAEIGPYGVTICSYDLAHRPAVYHRINKMSWDLAVFDECHYLKSLTATRTQAVLGARAFEKDGGIAAGAMRVWALSGTPAPNNITELYPLLAHLFPSTIAGRGNKVMSYDQFLYRYARFVRTQWGFKILGNKPDTLPELQAKLQPYVLRIRKSEVLPQLPPIRFETVEVHGFELAKKVRELEEHYAVSVDKLLSAVEAGGAVDGHLATLQRITEMAKAPAAVQLVTDELENNAIEKICIFARHVDVIDHLREALAQFAPAVIHGAISGKQREAAIDYFSDPKSECRVFIGQITAAGTAITLHANGACQDVLFVSADWVPANNAQAAARVHRVGQPGSVLVRFLQLESSTDEAVMQSLVRKTRAITQAFGDERRHHAA